jgi:hypothetical protein
MAADFPIAPGAGAGHLDFQTSQASARRVIALKARIRIITAWLYLPVSGL